MVHETVTEMVTERFIRCPKSAGHWRRVGARTEVRTTEGGWPPQPDWQGWGSHGHPARIFHGPPLNGMMPYWPPVWGWVSYLSEIPELWCVHVRSVLSQAESQVLTAVLISFKRENPPIWKLQHGYGQSEGSQLQYFHADGRAWTRNGTTFWCPALLQVHYIS